MKYDLYLSYSGNLTYQKCPKNYKLKYVDKYKVPRDPRNSMFGTAIGKIFEWFYERKIWKHEDPLSSCLELVSESVNWTMNHERFSITSDTTFVRKLLEEVKEFVPIALETIRKHGLLTPYSQTEVDLSVIYNGQFVIKIGGKADFIHSHDGENYWIMDGKGSKYGPQYVDNDQLIWYSLQYYLKYGRVPSRLGFIFWRYPDSPIGWIDFDGSSIDRVLADIIKNTKLILEKNFSPTPGRHCKFCDYSSSCEQGKIQIAAMESEKTVFESGINLDIDLM